ncbi:hypothetical protein AVEN_139650-1 [Araneus ventricosus]|uniref:Uncharacterized protein n=1 Tax=Araneus ventricosus TaxID=182803 RepID=A0A4Y2FTH3_ARAVE|nr:hypothetical protein AVEN_139650-1 [Araneus ventricosus]
MNSDATENYHRLFLSHEVSSHDCRMQIEVYGPCRRACINWQLRTQVHRLGSADANQWRSCSLRKERKTNRLRAVADFDNTRPLNVAVSLALRSTSNR